MEVIQNYEDPKLNYSTAYAKAFGACWGAMNDEQRQMVLDVSAKHALMLIQLDKENN